MLQTVATHLSRLRAALDVQIVLKGSFVKANRTSGRSATTIGEERALELLRSTARRHQFHAITDIHTPDDAERVAAYVDVLQIPAFLCRQTELIVAAARTGRAVMIKKGQFVAPEDMLHAVEKARDAGAAEVLLCERGTTFGYHNLVVDMRALLIMRRAGVPVVFDATHSVQLPSAGGTSGGQREFVTPLARAAAAVGVDGFFFETHPDPATAMSDAATQLPLDAAEEFIRSCVALDAVRRRLEDSVP